MCGPLESKTSYWFVYQERSQKFFLGVEGKFRVTFVSRNFQHSKKKVLPSYILVYPIGELCEHNSKPVHIPQTYMFKLDVILVICGRSNFLKLLGPLSLSAPRCLFIPFTVT